MRKLKCHVEFIIGDNMSEEDLQRIMDRGFDHAIFQMMGGKDLVKDSDYVVIEE